MAKNEPRLSFLIFPRGFCFIQVLIQVRTSPYHPDRDRWACLAAGQHLGLSFCFLSVYKRKALMKMFKSNSHQMRMDVEMESLQRYFLLSDEAEPEPGDQPQRLTAGADWRLHDLIPLLPLSARGIESGLSASVTRGQSSFVKWQTDTCLRNRVRQRRGK